MKVRVLLYNHVPKTAFIFQQLGLTSLRDLFIGKNFYFDQPALSFPDLGQDLTFHFINKKLSREDIQFAKAETPFDWTIHWPLHQYPINRESVTQILLDVFNSEISREIPMGEDSAFVIKSSSHEIKLHPESICCHNLAAEASRFHLLDLASPCRVFNHLELQQERIKKVCKDFSKGKAEAHFLTLVPAEIQEFFPALLKSEEKENLFSYEIPRFNMLDLSRFLIHGSLRDSEWQSVFAKLDEYFSTVPQILVSATETQNSLRELFIEKLQQRHREYQAQSGALDISALVSELCHQLEEAIQSSSERKLFFSHGDLCFSNILIDRNNFEMKFIDARGALSPQEVFLPLAYDFAKLSHCIHGRYDWIMAGDLQVPYAANLHRQLKAHFEHLLRKHGLSERLVRLGEASLFLSMLPKHIDQPELHTSMIQAAEKALLSVTELSYAG